MYLFRDAGSGYAGGMIDLKRASRDELIRLVVAQHETIARQEQLIADPHAAVARMAKHRHALFVFVVEPAVPGQ